MDIFFFVLGLVTLVGDADLLVRGASRLSLSFDLPVMIAVSLVCLPIFFTGSRIARWEATLFLVLCVASLAYLILAAQKPDALTAYGWMLAGFVLPMIGLTLLVVSWREWPSPAPALKQEDRG